MKMKIQLDITLDIAKTTPRGKVKALHSYSRIKEI